MESIVKKFKGIVVSDKMDKTIVVRVNRVHSHPKYGKKSTLSTRFKVHDEQNKYKINDIVEFVECRPYSKDKRWRVI